VTSPANSPKALPEGAEDPNLATTVLDPLSTPFNLRHDVDLLLSDLSPPTPLAVSVQELRAHREAVAARRSGAGRAVLIADSTPIARKFLALRLQSLGYEVHLADSGEQALGMIEQQAFAIVFLEAVLAPKDGIDGLRLCQAIKQMPQPVGGIEPAVVMVTRLAGSADRVRGSLAGCDAYLTKPLVEADFLAALAEVDPLFK
jgi:CheY-like chemotaxis protein